VHASDSDKMTAPPLGDPSLHFGNDSRDLDSVNPYTQDVVSLGICVRTTAHLRHWITR
jgi:hypothetical protein